MMNANSVSSAQNNWPLSNQRLISEDKQPLANAEIQKLTADIVEEESELKRINQEFSKYLSDGAQDMAKLKSAEMTQKQMQIQSMRLQISKLENPGKSSEAANSVAKASAKSGREKFDRYIKSGEEPEETPGLYRLETDENGNQKIVFDRSKREKDTAPADDLAVAPVDGAAEQIAAATQDNAIEGVGADRALPDITAPGEGVKKPEPEDGPKKKVEVGKSVGDDSPWKAEIDKIKQKKSQLSQKISNARDDEDKRKELAAQLAQVEMELAAKDTESYRKQRTVVRYLGSEPINAADAE